MKTLFPYLGFFLGVVIVAWILGSSDPITAAVVEARAETTTGPVVMSVIDQGMSAVLKLLAGATVASVLGFLMVEGSKWYRRITFERNTGRFVARRGGARPAQAPARNGLPKLTRDDLILALLGERLPERLPRKKVYRQEATDDIDLDF
jgi:hypothetical protein